MAERPIERRSFFARFRVLIWCCSVFAKSAYQIAENVGELTKIEAFP